MLLSLSFLLNVNDDGAIHVICMGKSANNSKKKKSNLVNAGLPDRDTCRNLVAAL